MTDEVLAHADAAIERKAFTEAIALLRPIAESGDRDAQFKLGYLAMTECEELTGKESFRWLMAAAEQGHAGAAYEIASFPDFVSEGFSSPLSPDENWQWLLRAAIGGCVEAQYSVGASLATAHLDDPPTPSDLPAALGWYRKAAEAGHAMAQFECGCMLLFGEGCELDRASGIYWLERAHASGDTRAEQVLLDAGEPPGDEP
jgi:uncharacterized protein